MNDLGMVVPLVARLTSGQTSATGTTYALEVENEGLKDKGVTAEDVTISLILPAGTKAVSATGTGYQGTKRDEKANADVAVWQLPKLAAHEHQELHDYPRGHAGGRCGSARNGGLCEADCQGGRGRQLRLATAGRTRKRRGAVGIRAPQCD